MVMLSDRPVDYISFIPQTKLYYFIATMICLCLKKKKVHETDGKPNAALLNACLMNSEWCGDNTVFGKYLMGLMLGAYADGDAAGQPRSLYAMYISKLAVLSTYYTIILLQLQYICLKKKVHKRMV